MKKINILPVAIMVAWTSVINAQQAINVTTQNVSYNFPSANVGLMNYSDGQSINIQGNLFNLAQIDKMAVLPVEIKDNTVVVDYSNESTHVTIAGNIAPYVSASVNGGHVVIEQSSEVGDNTCGEITYILSGQSTNGSFTLNGSYKASIELQGLTLTNPTGAAIDIENGKRIELSSKNETVNTLSDGADGSQKAAIYCKGHLELKGKGTLNVTGNKSHAIAAKEYVQVKNCTINILGAKKDGINCAQYFLMESGTLNISGTGDDGIQTDFKDAEADRESDDTGSIEIQGGTINISITATAAKAIKAEGNFTISGGELTARTTGAGDWDSTNLKTKASACISADGSTTIDGGTLILTATGGGGKGITCDGELTINSGTINIETSGGVLAYVNGSLNQNYTGNTDNLKSDYKSSPKGIKADGNVTINGGTIYIKTTGNNGEGIESKAILTINDGTITVRAKDDGINSSSHMYIKGGTIDVIATGNDGLDSNGNLYIQGGTIVTFGARAPECGIDANEEEGYTVIFTGGKILAVGGNNSVPRNSDSTQPYVITTGTVVGGNEISIGTGSETLFTFSVPEDYSYSSSGNGMGGFGGGWGPGGGSNSGNMNILISVPGLTNGTTYTIINGTTTTTASARLTGSSSGSGGRP